MASSAHVAVDSGDHAQTVAQHYNQLKETGLEGRTQSRIFYLRNFNNWTKSVLIADTLDKIRDADRSKQISVLDLGSGKGGDLLKWKKGGISHLVCADIAETSVQQSQERHRENEKRNRGGRMFSAEFYVADCTTERLKEKYKDPSKKFDLVSSQFSFHYCFESYPQAMMMIRNACECLHKGGYFIGTTPNSQELVRRLRGSSSNTFGNEVYNISFDETDKTDFPLFGAKYNFHLEGVVDCPEFLVYFPAFEKMASQFGMKLVSKTPFADFFKEKCEKSRDNVTLLSNMQALEPYPPQNNTEPVSSKESDYLIAKEFYSKVVGSQNSGDYNRPRQIGTMTLDEWEAATVYCVFVFQKVEDVSPADFPTIPGGASQTS